MSDTFSDAYQYFKVLTLYYFMTVVLKKIIKKLKTSAAVFRMDTYIQIKAYFLFYFLNFIDYFVK